MKRLTGITRIVVLALFSFVCAVATGVVALYVHGKSLPPSDGAYGMSVLDSLRDPFVFMVWAPLTLGPALVGWLVSLVTLSKTNLLVSIPIVFSVSVSVAALTASSAMIISPFAALGAAVVAMQMCYSAARQAQEQPPQESVFRQGLKHLGSRK